MNAGDVGGPDLRVEAVRGLRWSAITRPVIEILLLASMVVVARLVSPAEFGRVAIAIAVGELAVIVPSEGIGTALVQRATVEREHLQAGFALALVSAAVLAALMFLAAAVIVDPLFGDRTADFVRLSTPGFLLAGLAAVPFGILRRRLEFRLLSVIDLSTTATRAIAAVVLALAGLEGESLIFAGLLSGVVATTIALAKAPPPLPRLRRAHARELLSYGLPAGLASVSWVGFRNCDYAILGLRLGPQAAGLYYRAYTVAVEYQKKVSLVMDQIGFPVLARAAGPEHMAAMRGHMVRLLTIVLFPLLTVLAVVAPVLVPWLFGPAWAQAAAPTQILALGGAATLVTHAAATAVMAAGQARAYLAYSWAHFLTYGAAVYVVAPMGLSAVAAAAGVVHSVFLVVIYMLMLRGTGVRTAPALWRDVGPATTACVGLAAVIVPVGMLLSAAEAPAPAYLVGVGLVAVPAYLLALRLTAPATWQELVGFASGMLPTIDLRAIRRRWLPSGAPPLG